MKKIILLFVLFHIILFGQVEPTITLDSSTGNYIIRYEDDNEEIQEVIFEPATKIVPFVNAICFFDVDSNMYRYEYTITNGVNSQQRLLKFSIDYFAQIKNLKKPNNEWRSSFYSFVPALGWAHTMKDPYGMGTPYNGIAPDSSQSGFSFYSSSLPAIVRSYFEGMTPTLTFPDEPPGEVNILLDPLTRFPANTVQRKTLGPKDHPDPFIPTIFLDTLIYYTQESLNLGWITDQSTSDKYGSYFTKAQSQVQQNNINGARNTLGLVLQDVAQDSGDVLSSEAYALLRYNAEYLLAQLVEEEVTIDDLIAYINEAYKTGSINNKGIANSLISKLETARAQLDRGKSKQAINALEAFLNELEAQRGKHVNIDSYEYLRENVMSIIEQISGG